MRLLWPVALLWCTAIHGATVYKTVDENGVVSFSDAPPEDETATETLEIDVPVAQSPDDYLENLEAMRETTDRMAADRREREKHRAELRERQEQNKVVPLPSQPTQGYSDYTTYYPTYPVYRPRPGYPPWRPGHRPKPTHPIARPPVHPAYPGRGSANSQLMRPLVSPQNQGTANAQLKRPITSSRRD